MQANFILIEHKKVNDEVVFMYFVGITRNTSGDNDEDGDDNDEDADDENGDDDNDDDDK